MSVHHMGYSEMTGGHERNYFVQPLRTHISAGSLLNARQQRALVVSYMPSDIAPLL